MRTEVVAGAAALPCAVVEELVGCDGGECIEGRQPTCWTTLSGGRVERVPE